MRQRALAPLLIGRQPELSELRDHLGRAMAGAGQVVMLAGEAGVGKTRLLRELAQGLANNPGVVVLTGHCYDEQPAPPYGPFAELLGRLGQGASPALDDLRRLLDERSPLADAQADPQAERRRLFHAIYQALRPAEGQTHVLILEDLHWSDQASQDLLLYLARAVEGDRVLILGTFRTDEIHRLHPLAALIARLTRDRRYQELRLDPLSRGELAELVAATLGAEQPAALLSALYERTEGNPFFAEEVLESLLADGALDAAPGGIVRMGAIPLSIKDSILRRVAGLDEATTAALRAAAVIGRRFDFELLLRLTGASEATLLRSLAVLVERQLIAEEPGDSEDRYRFRHELIRQALYEEMLRRERRIRHQEVLRALEELHGANGEAVVEQLAYHAVSARAIPEAARYSLRAGEKAGRVHAYREALGHYEAALEFGEQSGALEDSARAELLARMGTTAYLIGDQRRATGYWREALPLHQALGERRRAADILRWLGRAAWDGNDAEAAFSQTRAALELLEGEGPCRELAMAYSAMSHLYMFQIFEGKENAADACIGWGERALAMAEALGDDGVTTHALNNIGVAMVYSGDADEGIARLRRSLAIALEADLPADAVRAYINLGGKLCKIGRHAEGLALQREGYAFAARHGYIRGSGKLLVSIYYSQLEAGEWDGLDTALTEALRPGFPGTSEDRAQLQYFYASLLLDRGRPGEARDVIEAALNVTDDLEGSFMLRGLLVLALSDLGDLPAALALADELRAQLLRDTGPGAGVEGLGARSFCLEGVVEIYLAAGRREEARAIVEAQLAATRHLPVTEIHCALAAELSGVTLTPESADKAADELANVLSRYERLGYLPLTVRVRRRRAEALLRSGTQSARAEAAGELRAARATAERIGFTRELAQIAAVEEQLAPTPRVVVAPPGQAQPRPVDGLTPRELEVLALITRGLSNRAIAETLVISEKTAEVHVRNILAKLGFSSRTQAATYAVERGLGARSA